MGHCERAARKLASWQIAEAHRSGALRPAEGLPAEAAHDDRAVSGDALRVAGQVAQMEHAAALCPPEGPLTRRRLSAADDDGAIGRDCVRETLKSTPRKIAEADHPTTCGPPEGLDSQGGAAIADDGRSVRGDRIRPAVGLPAGKIAEAHEHRRGCCRRCQGNDGAGDRHRESPTPHCNPFPRRVTRGAGRGSLSQSSGECSARRR